MCGAISRVMSFKTIICLGRLLPAASSDLPGDRTGRPMVSIFGLASDGVYMATCCYQRHGGLLHRLFTLTTFVAVIFCCTFLRVTSTGRYPASCPAKPGLSSPVLLQPRSFIPLAYLLNINFLFLSTSLLQYDKQSNLKTASSHKFPDQRIVWKIFAADAQKILQ